MSFLMVKTVVVVQTCVFLKFGKIQVIYEFLGFWQWNLGAFPSLPGVLGMSVKGAKTLTISVCPFFAPTWFVDDP